MVTVNTTDLMTALPDLLERVRRGESVLLLQDGQTVAQIGPAPEAEDDERPWRGVFTDLPPVAPTIVFPKDEVPVPRRDVPPSLAWLPERDGEDD